MRPRTAPAYGAGHRRPSLQCWTQVDVLLRDVLLGAAVTAADQANVGEAVASAAASGSRRPHTACVGARPLAVVRVGDEDDSDAESDGGSADDSDDAARVGELRRRGASAAAASSMQRPPSAAAAMLQAVLSDNASDRRPLTSSGRPAAPVAPKGGGYPAGSASSSSTAAPGNVSAYGAAEVLNLEASDFDDDTNALEDAELPFEHRVLLGGIRQPVAKTLNVKRSKPAAASAAGYPTPQTPSASTPSLRLINSASLRLMSGSMRAAGPAEIHLAAPTPELDSKLPRKAFIGGAAAGQRQGARGGVAMKPRAARMQSHVSWASFTPMRFGGPKAADKLPTASSSSATSSTPTAEVATVSSTVSPGPVLEVAAVEPAAVAAPSTAAAAGAVAAARAAGAVAAARAAAVVAAAKAKNEQNASIPAVALDTVTGVSRACRIIDDTVTEAVQIASVGEVGEASTATPATSDVVEGVPQRRRPKYQVVPGGSRPMQRGAASSAPKQASNSAAIAPEIRSSKPAAPHEFVVLEFRSEPRVVPASRSAGGKVTKHSIREGTGVGSHRFRPSSRQWAQERDVIAAKR